MTEKHYSYHKQPHKSEQWGRKQHFWKEQKRARKAPTVARCCNCGEQLSEVNGEYVHQNTGKYGCKNGRTLAEPREE